MVGRVDDHARIGVVLNGLLERLGFVLSGMRCHGLVVFTLLFYGKSVLFA